MSLITFILGLALGMTFCIWKQNQSKSKLRQVLNSVAIDIKKLPRLPMMLLVRRILEDFQQTNHDLLTQLQTWEILLENAPIAYLQVDEENQLLWCNQQAQTLLKIEHWPQKKPRLLLELVRSYELDQLIEDTRESGTHQVKEWLFHYVYGQQPLILPIQPRYLKAFSYTLAHQQVGIFLLDQQPFVELSQSRDRAFSDLSHELRTPLTSINLLAQTLEASVNESDKFWLEQMLKEIDRLINLIDKWLEISRLQKNPTQHLHYETRQLPELIISSWETVAPLARKKAITLNYSGLTDIEIEADPSRLNQVFINLFDNAIKHSPEQGVIQVKVTREKSEALEWIEINIIDAGCGFNESDLPYIFDRLYRADTGRKKTPDLSGQQISSSDGSGLGLSIVKEIIEAHHGSIEAKNNPETGGGWLKVKLYVI